TPHGVRPRHRLSLVSGSGCRRPLRETSGNWPLRELVAAGANSRSARPMQAFCTEPVQPAEAGAGIDGEAEATALNDPFQLRRVTQLVAGKGPAYLDPLVVGQHQDQAAIHAFDDETHLEIILERVAEVFEGIVHHAAPMARHDGTTASDGPG